MLTFRDDDVRQQIQREIGLKPSFALEAFADLEEDVRQSVARIEASRLIPHRDSLRGFVYDVRTGVLREVQGDAASRHQPRAAA
jgi:carbonic anhydrase